jgi:hypothetical protein
MSGFNPGDDNIIKKVANANNDSDAAALEAVNAYAAAAAAANANAAAAANITYLQGYVNTITLPNIYIKVDSIWIDTFDGENGIKYLAMILYYRVKYIGTEFCKTTCQQICMSFREDKTYITIYYIDKFYKLCSIFFVFNYLLNFVNSLTKLTNNVFFFICSFLSELFKNFGVEYNVYVNFINILNAYNGTTQTLNQQTNKDYNYAHDLNRQMIEKLTLVYSRIFHNIDFKSIVSGSGINIFLDLEYYKIAESKDLYDGQLVFLKFAKRVWLDANDATQIYKIEQQYATKFEPDMYYPAQNYSKLQYDNIYSSGQNDLYHLENNIKIQKNAQNQPNFRDDYTVYVKTTQTYQLCRALVELYKKNTDPKFGSFVFNAGSKTKRQRKQRQRKQKQKSKRKKN